MTIKWEYQGKRYYLLILQDDTPDNPRHCNDSHLDTMACFHRRYNLGDILKDKNPEEFWQRMVQENTGIDSDVLSITECMEIMKPFAVWLPLWLYDHSGITIRIYPYNDTWDSRWVGWIVVRREHFESEKAAIEYMRANVKTYDQYLAGETYGFTLYEKVNKE